MEHHEVTRVLGLLFVMLAAAKLLGFVARRFGQPSVLGELIAGVLVGKSLLGLVDPSTEVFHVFAELGVILLLFSIGLETDLTALLKAGPAATAVAIAGVILPFGLGYVATRFLGQSNAVSIVTGAALTATSVGITARVLSDLGRLQDPEGQVILGAAILDDIIGLVILTVVAGMTGGDDVSAWSVLKTVAIAFGFLGVAVVAGRPLIQWLVPVFVRDDLPGTPAILALLLALGLGWLADSVGSAAILGAFVAGVLLVGTPRFHDIEVGVTRLGHFFVPLFFVAVGAAVDMRALNPLNPANLPTLLVACVLTLAAVAGKYAAGYAPYWFPGRKSVIGAGMIPRGEVGLIFAQMGRDGGVLDEGLFAAVTVVVMITTFLAPPLLKFLVTAAENAPAPSDHEGIEDFATEG